MAIGQCYNGSSLGDSCCKIPVSSISRYDEAFPSLECNMIGTDIFLAASAATVRQRLLFLQKVVTYIKVEGSLALHWDTCPPLCA